MRFVRTIAGMMLLAVAVPLLLAGAVLWVAVRHTDPDGGFGARFETVRTPGRAVVVADVDRLLRAEAPFARAGQARLRLTAQTADGPAFLGLAPADQAQRWLAGVPHATVSRVALARGPLPVRLEPADPAAAGTAPAPLDQSFWVREGLGVLEWSPAELANRSVSLVVMRPDGAADLALDLHAALRAGWFPGTAWALLAGGALLMVLAVVTLLRPVRSREVVFVVEPDQVPVLAGRLGVTSLSGLGQRREPPALPERQLVSLGVARAEQPRPAIGPVPGHRPETLAGPAAAPAWSCPPVSPDGAWRGRPGPDVAGRDAEACDRPRRRVALRAADTEGHRHRGKSVLPGRNLR